MKLYSFIDATGNTRIGWEKDNKLVDMNLAHTSLPTDMLNFIDHHLEYFKIIARLQDVVPHYTFQEVKLLPPLPNPRSFRDYIGFEQHMLNASKSFGHTIGPSWYDMPIFYFTNHQAISGSGAEIKRPLKETKMDLELEIAVIIGKKGSNIIAQDAEDYIFGYTIFNDWTARAIQRKEMEVPLGPHKGKDFANTIGPCIVTKDEFEKYRCVITKDSFPSHLKFPPDPNYRFDIKMSAKINGQLICDGNYNSVYWTFPYQIQRASENDVTLMPGDILGSGTLGWGSLIENNFSVHRPLEPGDIVELEIEGIGSLKNKII